MVRSADDHLKLLLGDFAVQLALVRAENDALRESVATLQAQISGAPKKKPRKRKATA